VFVTHDQEEALELSDRVVVMSQGKVEQIGTPDEIYDAPNSPFVFSFIGESSALPVRIEDCKVWLENHQLDLSPGEVSGGPAQLFFRPDDVEIVSGPSGAIPGIVSALRRHAGWRRADLDVGRQGDRIEIEFPADKDLKIGAEIGVRPRRYRLYPASPS
jgi:sulfate transport system ATP-binding protein